MRWKITLEGKMIDEVSYNDDISREDVKQSLINHDGFSSEINLRRVLK